MKSLKQLLDQKKRAPVTIAPNDTIYDALTRMAEHDIGALLVMDGDRLVGVFSERDYARKVILRGKSSRDTLVHEAMSDKVFYVTGSQSVEECMAIMTDRHIRHLPVLDGQGKVVGFLSIGDSGERDHLAAAVHHRAARALHLRLNRPSRLRRRFHGRSASYRRASRLSERLVCAMSGSVTGPSRMSNFRYQCTALRANG